MYREIAATERQYVEGHVRPLNLKAVHTYWELFEIGDTLSFKEFWECIRLIDHIWLKQVTADEERRQAAKPKAPKAPRKR